MSAVVPGRAGSSVRVVSVLTHRRPDQVAEALCTLRRLARETGCVVRLDQEEAEKHGLQDAPQVDVGSLDDGVDLCVALGGDGTILQALRRYAGTGVPTFGVNFGELGFLASAEPDEAEEALGAALRGETPRLALPALEAHLEDGAAIAVNDIAVLRRPGERVPALGYAIDGLEIGRVNCDGLVVATPAGSTGYNLANGGPVLAWGVEGYVVSFIAPHTLTARALVVDPGATIEIRNGSQTTVDLAFDGRAGGTLGAGDAMTVAFRPERTLLAQPHGAGFYRRLEQKFGRLAG